MGWGDEIMASGHARVEAARIGGRVHIVDARRRPRWHELWRGLGWIAKPGEQSVGSVMNAGHCRPYIEYPFTREGGQRFTRWQARDHVGAIALDADERAEAAWLTEGLGRFWIIEPEIAPLANPNKQWGRDRWVRLAALAKGTIPFVQLLPQGRQPIPGVTGLPTRTFRIAAAVMDNAVAAVLPEGGLHHAAAALGKPAVVLFGGAAPVDNIGYPLHDNIVNDADGTPCGRWVPCAHCAAFWKRLSPETVFDHVRRLSARLESQAA